MDQNEVLMGIQSDIKALLLKYYGYGFSRYNENGELTAGGNLGAHFFTPIIKELKNNEFKIFK